MSEVDSLEVQKAREIKRAFDFYFDTFASTLALLIAEYEKIPLELDNQIRNAFTHLARASSLNSIMDIKIEVDRAIAHIDRANRDCFKAIIIESRSELAEIISDVVFFRGFLTPAIKAKYDEIELNRKKAFVAETKGDEQSVFYLKDIAFETLDLIDKIKEQYHEAGSKKTRFFRFFKRWSRPVGYLIATALGAAIGFALRPYVGIWALQLIDWWRN